MLSHFQIIELVSEIEIYEKYGRLDLLNDKTYGKFTHTIQYGHGLEERTVRWLKNSDKGVSMFVLGDFYSSQDGYSKRSVGYYINGWEKYSNSICALILAGRCEHVVYADGTDSGFHEETSEILEHILEKKDSRVLDIAKIIRGGEYGVMSRVELKSWGSKNEIYGLYQNMFFHKTPNRANIILENLENYRSSKSDLETCVITMDLTRMARKNRDYDGTVAFITFILNRIHKNVTRESKWLYFNSEKNIKKWYNDSNKNREIKLGK